MPHIATASELRERTQGQTATQHAAAIRQAHQDHYDSATAVLDAADGRDLRASERTTYDRHMDNVRSLETLAHTVETGADYRAEHDAHMRSQREQHADILGGGPADSTSYRDGRPLTRSQSFEGFVRSRQLVREGENELSLTKYIRGMATGQWDDADAERRAMAEGTNSAGGYLVPTVLSAQIIDLVRNQARVLQAGAQIVPMTSRTLDVAKWLSDPTAAWHTENAVIAPSDASVGTVRLTAHSLASLVQCSWELIEDTRIEAELAQAFASVFSLKLDQAALYGSGVDPEPLGVKNMTAVTKTSLGTNGATPANYDFLVDAAGRLEDVNESPTAAIYAGRTARVLSKVKDTTGQPIVPPEYVRDLTRYSTGQIPTNLTVGTSTDTSDLFVADWSQLLVGVRTQLVLKPLTERYADTGTTGFLAWWRGDTVAARSKAFDVTTGIRG